MTPPPLIDDAGRPVRLDRRLAAGGEGAVFSLPNDPSAVAKVYHQPPSTQTAEKLTALTKLSAPQLLNVAAWPTRVLFDARTRFAAGFLMPRLDGFEPMQGLYNPAQRLRAFPRAGWDFQLRAAANLAAAFDEVHKVGCLVGDVNQSNAFVSSKALVRLIDCDSFQVQAGGKRFLCEVGTPLYIPPELVGKPLRGLTRTENHDRFGLAVLIYQLLFVGRHPYAGVYSGKGDPSFDELIAGYKFAQGPAAFTWGMAPPPHTPTFADLPPAVGDLFRRAFERGSEAGTRPRPADWLAVLGQLEQELATCKTDPGHKHWRGAGGCVWCRLANNGGPEYYFGVAGGSIGFVVDETRLGEVLRRLAAVPADPFPYTRAAFVPAVRPAGRAMSGVLAQLLTARQTARSARQTAVDQRRVVEHQELRASSDRERQAITDVEATYRRRDAELAAEYDAERKVSIVEMRKGRRTTRLLASALAVGFILLCLGCAHKAFLIAGGLVLLPAGIWLTDHLTRSPAAVTRRRLHDLTRQRAAARAHADRRVQAARDRSGRVAAEADAVTRNVLRPHDDAARAAEETCQRRFKEELTARRRAFADAEAAVQTAEWSWANVADGHRRRHQDVSQEVGRLVAGCRNLAGEYQTYLGRLTAGAEAAARVRHLRLHLLADADIPNVGAGRKQALAAAGVYTAADVQEATVRSVKGFGDSLTAAVIAWRAEVLRRFRFDPVSAVPPASLREVTARYLARQQQLVAEAGRHLIELEASATAGRETVQGLTPRLRTALGEYEQARADLAALPHADT